MVPDRFTEQRIHMHQSTVQNRKFARTTVEGEEEVRTSQNDQVCALFLAQGLADRKHPITLLIVGLTCSGHRDIFTMYRLKIIPFRYDDLYIRQTILEI